MTEKFKKCKKLCAVFLAVTMVLGIMPMGAYAATSDLTNHWAKEVIENWSNEGLIGGYPDGSFRPDNAITRAEFMALINKAFGFQESGEISFTDVEENAWFYDVIKVAVQTGYIGGYTDGTMKPDNPITRQEAASIIGKIAELEESPNHANGFEDASHISEWGKGFVGAVVETGYMSGYPDGTFQPLGNITRAEAVVALSRVRDNMLLTESAQEDRIYDEGGTYGPRIGSITVETNVVVSASDVVLQNMVIQGSLTISEEVGNGDVHLKNITVEGATYIRGGGKDSIHIQGGSYNSIIIEETSSGSVRIVAVDITGLELIISENAAGQEILLEGTIESVVVNASDIQLETQGTTTIKSFIVNEGIENVALTLGTNTNIEKLTADSKVAVTGGGTIEETEGKEVRNSSFGGTVGTTPPSSGGSGGGGGGGGGGGSTTPTLTVTNRNMILAGGTYSGIDLSDEDDSVRVSGISFTVNAASSTLRVNQIVSPKMGTVETTRTISFDSRNAVVTVSQLLGFDQGTISLGTLRDAFGTQVEVRGVLSASGYTAYTTPIVIILGGDSNDDETVNDWAEVTQAGNVITAVLKDGQESTKLSEIGIAAFLSTTFHQLPSEVKIESHDWIDVQAANYQEIKDQLGALGSGWNTVELNDLVGQSIQFKTAGSSTTYTLEIE